MKTSSLWVGAFATAIQVIGASATNKAAYCHYLVGTVDSNSNHAALDIAQAQAMGFDAFALDLLDPTADYTKNTLEQLFAQAGSANFKLFFSVDAGAHPNIPDFPALVNQYLGNKAYYLSPANGKPFLSTFDGGSKTINDWQSFKSSLNQEVYFVPDFDDAQGYYTNPGAFFNYWESVLSGVFSWESTWPETSSTPQNESISQDESVQTAAHNATKAYMMGLSTLQFKHLNFGNGNINNWYRAGAVNLPERMTDILSLGSNMPDYVEVITWNDGGESHYIGNVWPEGSNYPYAKFDHSGWQPLIQSFVTAYKQGLPASKMTPPKSAAFAGAMWYHPLLKTAKCASDPLGPPSGQGGIVDAVNFGLVLPANSQGYKVVVTTGISSSNSAGTKLPPVSVGAGLSYASVPGLQVGTQKLELFDGSGKLVAQANGNVSVQADASACNYNYVVVGLS